MIWGPHDHGDPYPDITNDMGMGVIISLSDTRLPPAPHNTSSMGIPGDIEIPRESYSNLWRTTYKVCLLANGHAVQKFESSVVAEHVWQGGHIEWDQMEIVDDIDE